MFINAAILALAFASGANAHALMYGVWVNGVDQGDGRNVYIRTPPNNSPVKDLASPNLACNVNGAKAASSFVQAAAGDSLTFEWLHNTRGDDIIAGSHKGPIITYIAPYTEGNGADSIWTKIAEDGYDSATKLWAVDKLIAAKGKQDFILPANLASGRYLIRQEIIAHHESDTAFNVNSARGAQFYPSCVQVEVTGSGTAVPDQDFNFNTGYTYADPGIVFNLYGAFTSYQIPGPEVWAASGSSPAPSSPAPSSTSTSSAAAATSTPAAPVETETPTSSAVVVPVPTTTAAPTTLVTSTSKPRPTKCPGRRRRRAARASRL
ncbi:glycosyl hydrolase family 61-domain-containing protein [Parachaetomium inaequale]|uniref:lytic cellulose monooxygenase (C4-dehydrogenating) n=1 Tax=Parachaetomium inaequale TaxID=2588326 RepID=A0AAN6SQT6_9PEZI|nr:glycosyl hydrolase family 61-domain-containing protein [Parachaetomium inaequale]